MQSVQILLKTNDKIKLKSIICCFAHANYMFKKLKYLNEIIGCSVCAFCLAESLLCYVC